MQVGTTINLCDQRPADSCAAKWNWNAAPKLKLVEKENSALWPRQKCWWSFCRGRLGEGNLLFIIIIIIIIIISPKSISSLLFVCILLHIARNIFALYSLECYWSVSSSVKWTTAFLSTCWTIWLDLHQIRYRTFLLTNITSSSLSLARSRQGPLRRSTMIASDSVFPHIGWGRWLSSRIWSSHRDDASTNDPGVDQEKSRPGNLGPDVLGHCSASWRCDRKWHRGVWRCDQSPGGDRSGLWLQRYGHGLPSDAKHAKYNLPGRKAADRCEHLYRVMHIKK